MQSPSERENRGIERQGRASIGLRDGDLVSTLAECWSSSVNHASCYNFIATLAV